MAPAKAIQPRPHSPGRMLLQSTKSSYLHFIWGMSFGVVAVLATPLISAVALFVALCKNTHETLMHSRRS